MSQDPKNEEKKTPATKLPELEPAQEIAETDLEDIAGGCAVISCVDSCNGVSNVTGGRQRV